MYVIIAGGGLLGQGLAAKLVEGRHDVVLIEKDRAVCERLSASMGALVIHGNATSIEILEEAGVKKADVAVGALRIDADNLAFSVLTRNFGVARVIARMRNPKYEGAYRFAGVSRVLNVGELLVPRLVLEIEQPALRHLVTFGEGEACIVVVTIPDGALVDGQTVGQITQDKDFPADCVIAGIYRQDPKDFVFPRGPAEIRSGDQVFLAAHSATVREASRFLMRT